MKEIDSLEVRIFRQIDKRIVQLASEPRPPNARKLKGPIHDLFRLRSGDYRILYTVNDTEREVIVLSVRKRDENTYGRLPSL